MKRKMIEKIAVVSLSATLAFAPIVSNACTSFLLKANDGGFVYGRTMEFGPPLNSKLAVIPRDYKELGVGVDSKPGTGLNWTTKYAAVGMNALGLPVLVDGMNEKGLIGGLLYAPNTAMYQNVTPADSANSISSAQMLTYALTNFATVDEVIAGFKKIKVNRSVIPSFNNQTLTVRMTIHDATGKSIVIEYAKGEMIATANPTGALTNDPLFSEHLNNIGNYANLTPVERAPVVINGASFKPPSSGSGLHGLPGDYLSPSRFIRAVFLSKSAPANLSSSQQTNTAWHILGSFDIPPGAISLSPGGFGGGSGGFETTEWSVVADNKNMMYYVKMFTNTNLQAFDFKKVDMNAKEIKVYDLDGPQTYKQLN